MINLISVYRIGRWFYLRKLYFVSRIIELIIFLIYNSRVPMSASIGRGSKFAYSGIGCVLHERTIIGDNVMIGTNITIGGRSKKYKVPIIGDNVYIGTGAKILGPITIGNNVTVGANAVVITDLPENSIAAGVPAKILKNKND